MAKKFNKNVAEAIQDFKDILDRRTEFNDEYDIMFFPNSQLTIVDDKPVTINDYEECFDEMEIFIEKLITKKCQKKK